MMDIIIEKFIDFERLIEQKIGYIGVIVFEDLTVFFSGIFIGVLLMTFFTSFIFLRSKRLEGSKFDKFSVIKYYQDNKPIYFLNPKGLFDTMRMTLLLVFAPWFTIRTYTLRDEKRTKLFITIMSIFATIIIILAILSIYTVYFPNGYRM